MKKGHIAKAQREKKKSLSQELVLLQTLPWEEKMKEKRKRVGKMGWLFCFKPRFNISIENNHYRGKAEKYGGW